MWKGNLIQICISPSAGQPMQSVQSLRALAGIGLEGDRYASRQGTYSANDDGIRLCEPCQNLAGLTQAGVLPGLIHRGGLRAEIINEGIIRVGDPITEGTGIEEKYG